MATTIQPQTLYQTYCNRCMFEGAIAEGKAVDEPAITASDDADNEDIEHLDHYLQHIEKDHDELVLNQQEVSEIASANTISVQTEFTEQNDQDQIIKDLRREIDEMKEEKANFEITRASLSNEKDEFKEKCKQLIDRLSTAEQREVEMQVKHKDEVERLNGELARLGKENEKLKKMVGDLTSKLSLMDKLQREERQAAKKEREKQEKYRENMDEKFRKQENHNRKMEAQNRDILNLLRGMKMDTDNTNSPQKTTIHKKSVTIKEPWKR